jgi:hypothetical protein
MAATDAPTREAAPERQPVTPGQRPGRPAEETTDPEEEQQEVPPGEEDEEAEDEEDEEEEGQPKGKPPDLNALLDKADPASLRKHPRLAGIIGEQARREATRLAEQRAEELVREREERWRAERSRQEVLAKARNGDYYAIGEQAAREALQRDQEGAVNQFTRQAEAKTYQRMQDTLEEWATTQPEEVREAAAERMGELDPGTPWETGFRKWLDAYVQVRAEHLARQPETQQRAERDVMPAVRARVLAEMNGKEPTADSGSGRAQRVRKITDDDIARMSLEQYMEVWDVENGRPKKGVVYTPTRALDPRAMQVRGGTF